MADDTKKLAQMASEINDLHWQSEAAGDDCRLKLALKLVEAKEAVGAESWEAWVEEHLDLSSGYVSRMLIIGNAKDPKKALAEERAATRQRVAKHREMLLTLAGRATETQGEVGTGTGSEAADTKTTPEADDTHVLIGLPQSLSKCRTEDDVLKRVQFQKHKGRWFVCVEEKPPQDAAVEEPQPAQAEAA